MTSEPKTPKEPEKAKLRIGAFVLETLTLGMYGEPLHTLREYVQNSFDAIQEAERSKQLSTRGTVSITYSDNEIKIRDNGAGVSASAAWDTLTSIGASKKDRMNDAGFRGIGRLAGMAYCEELQFRTSFLGESEVSVVTFNAAALLEGMNPDEGGAIELADLLSSNVRLDQTEKTDEQTHYFEVVMIGLEKAPRKLTLIPDVKSYLRETLPLGYNTEWQHAKDIQEGHKNYTGYEMPNIDVVLDADGSKTNLTKHYGDVYNYSKGSMNLESVDFFDDGDGKRFWGWVGSMKEPGAITDKHTRGVRIRVRNIQVDGAEIFDDLFRSRNSSYGRFNSYYVGEFFISPSSIVPNARRDGFEETKAWDSIKDKFIKLVCQPLAKDAYAKSREVQNDAIKLLEKVDALEKKSKRLVQSSKATYDQVVNLLHEAKSLRVKARNSVRKISDADAVSIDIGDNDDQYLERLRSAVTTVESAEEQAKSLIGSMLDDDSDELVQSLRERLRSELINEVLDLLRPQLETETFRRVKKELQRRIEEV